MTLRGRLLLFPCDCLQPPLVAGAGRDIEIKRSLGLGSTLVTIIILGFMLAANRFIGKRSKDETCID